MEAILSPRFLTGVFVGVALFYLWQMRMAKKNG